jgi:hypothetical protein
MVRDANGHAFFWWFGGDNLVFKPRRRSAEIRPPAIIEFSCLGLVFLRHFPKLAPLLFRWRGARSSRTS